MIDVSQKPRTPRTAVAQATVLLVPATVTLVREQKVPKGNPPEVAKVAAVQAAKSTHQIIPYCHPMPVDYVGAEYAIGTDRIDVKGTVKTVYKTGVEIEVKAATLVVDWGIEGDAHSGTWHRQVSLLAVESIDKMQAKGLRTAETRVERRLVVASTGRRGARNELKMTTASNLSLGRVAYRARANLRFDRAELAGSLGDLGTFTPLLGAIKMTLALLFGGSPLGWIRAYPQSMLGVLLLFSGIGLALVCRDQSRREDFFVTVLTAGACLALNTGVGFLVGWLMAAALTRGVFRIEPPKPLALRREKQG